LHFDWLIFDFGYVHYRKRDRIIVGKWKYDCLATTIRMDSQIGIRIIIYLAETAGFLSLTAINKIFKFLLVCEKGQLLKGIGNWNSNVEFFYDFVNSSYSLNFAVSYQILSQSKCYIKVTFEYDEIMTFET
jgi:hypothetical protein